MKIAVSGLSGCGNTTTSEILATRLGFTLVNFTFKNLAVEKGMSFDELCALAKTTDEIDKELDRRQVEMAEKVPDAILASRLAIWMLKDADYRVYLKASSAVRAKRIQKREGGELSVVEEKTAKRDESDHSRYLKLYGINNYDYSIADAVLDTDDKSAEAVADLIYTDIKKRFKF